MGSGRPSVDIADVAKVAIGGLHNAGIENRGASSRRTQEGTPNKHSAEIREAARKYGPEAAATACDADAGQQNEDVRQRSANVTLDRAYGKPAQPVSNADDNPIEPLMQHLDGTSRGLPSEQQRIVVAAMRGER